MKRTELVLICLVLCLPVVAFGAQGQPFQQLQDQINQIDTKLQNFQLTPGPQGPAGPVGSTAPTPAELSGPWSCTAYSFGGVSAASGPPDSAWIPVDLFGLGLTGTNNQYIQLNNATLIFNDNENGTLSLTTSAPDPFNPFNHDTLNTVCSIIGDNFMVKTFTTFTDPMTYITQTNNYLSIYRFTKWDSTNFILLNASAISPIMISCSR